jgi:hypothetical protein
MEVNMCSIGRIRQIAFIVVIATMLSGPVQAGPAESTDWGLLVALQAGWNLDRMLVFPKATPLKNPGGCNLTTNGYIIDENTPGRKTFYALLLGALLNGKEVAFVIQDCFEDRPKIVSAQFADCLAPIWFPSGRHRRALRLP